MRPAGLASGLLWRDRAGLRRAVPGGERLRPAGWSVHRAGRRARLHPPAGARIAGRVAGLAASGGGTASRPAVIGDGGIARPASCATTGGCRAAGGEAGAMGALRRSGARVRAANSGRSGSSGGDDASGRNGGCRGTPAAVSRDANGTSVREDLTTGGSGVGSVRGGAARLSGRTPAGAAEGVGRRCRADRMAGAGPPPSPGRALAGRLSLGAVTGEAGAGGRGTGAGGGTGAETGDANGIRGSVCGGTVPVSAAADGMPGRRGTVGSAPISRARRGPIMPPLRSG